MKNIWIPVVVLPLVLMSMATLRGLDSSVYDWEKYGWKKTSTGMEKKFITRSSRSLDMLDIKAVTLLPGENGNGYQIDFNFDELIIVKEGAINILANNDQKTLGEGSIVVVCSGDEVYITNPQNTNAVYYLIGFKAHKPVNNKAINKDTFDEYVDKMPPLFIDWKDVEFKTSANGGRRNIMQQRTTLLKELEIHVTTLREGLPSHAAHTHPDEEIILIRKGYVEETIKGKPYRLGPGSIIFLSNDDLHGIRNAGTGECEYYAIRWLTE